MYQGVKKYKKGGIYTGQLKNGKREGKGKMIYPTDSKFNQFEGDWHNDKMHGTGILITDNSRYEGQVKNNERNGLGKQTNFDGSSYEGEYTDGDFNG